MSENKKENQIDIELTEEVADGIYSNLAIISHSNSEFILDFVRMLPGVPKAKVKSRIILSPEHAKRLLMALGENISRYENNFGEIHIPENLPEFPMNSQFIRFGEPDSMCIPPPRESPIALFPEIVLLTSMGDAARQNTPPPCSRPSTRPLVIVNPSKTESGPSPFLKATTLAPL